MLLSCIWTLSKHLLIVTRLQRLGYNLLITELTLPISTIVVLFTRLTELQNWHHLTPRFFYQPLPTPPQFPLPTPNFMFSFFFLNPSREVCTTPLFLSVYAVDWPAPPLLEKTASPSPSSCYQQLTARQNMMCTASFSMVGFELKQTLLVLNQN